MVEEGERRAATVQRARSLRVSMTAPEQRLWAHLRDRRLGGYKFVRQMPIGRYVADFACRERRLIVEVDGWQHAESRRDRVRDDALRVQGYRVLRFWNDEVSRETENVLETILAALEGRLD